MINFELKLKPEQKLLKKKLISNIQNELHNVMYQLANLTISYLNF